MQGDDLWPNHSRSSHSCDRASSKFEWGRGGNTAVSGCKGGKLNRTSAAAHAAVLTRSVCRVTRGAAKGTGDGVLTACAASRVELRWGVVCAWLLGGMAPCRRGYWVEWHRTDVDFWWNGTVQTWILGGMAPYRRGCWVEWCVALPAGG